MPAFTPWQEPSANYPAGDAPFRAAETGGPAPYFHDPLDALRSMHRRTPNAMFPDGYLGTVNSRREGRLRHGGPIRQDNKPYSRGVHKGERQDARDYFWPDEFQPTDGIKAQMEGRRYVSPGILMEAGMVPVRDMINENGPSMAKVGQRGVPGRVGTVAWDQGRNPDRAAQLGRLIPPWAGPGMGVGTAYPGR